MSGPSRSPYGFQEVTETADRAEPGQPASPELQQARRRCAGLAILSTLPFHRSTDWNAAVRTLPAKRRVLSFLWRWTGITDPVLVPRLLWHARRADVVLLNGGERVDLVYLALAGLAPWIRAPHIVVDAHWQAHGGWRGRLQRWLLELGEPVLHEVQPHSAEEIEVYHREFGIPRDKVHPVPWSTSLTGYRLEIGRKGGRDVVSGGFSYRDYATLFEAVRRAGLTLDVGLPRSPQSESARQLAADYPGIRIVEDWSMQGYWQAVADARVFAMALTPGLNRCSADQTLLNALSLGTLVVATDSVSTRLYLRDGENAMVVPAGDVEALAAALRRAMELPAEDYQRITGQARADIESEHREETRLARTLERAARAGQRTASGFPIPKRGARLVWVTAISMLAFAMLLDSLA
ncbi:glycosyltransferase [Pseudomarimonas salicorniae]|uniref:Glycosyltransferase n=1 Tax=Pseudomarimonas salicorniae TaxID=2933270 RepID=A0ABT0GGS3_9GAMM|nr:glycosyltransferase [Lysobacter sp. CAU 1642]MCK7593733.1 glycosyltransferase [Lysobacter sp. CAU 1642]